MVLIASLFAAACHTDQDLSAHSASLIEDGTNGIFILSVAPVFPRERSVSSNAPRAS